ncbi:MAG: CotH kinase family protein, partial [Lachnospiraceae bacterium]|nr:CotH kinase family protein [Lachnospiraceae bacterium]
MKKITKVLGFAMFMAIGVLTVPDTHGRISQSVFAQTEQNKAAVSIADYYKYSGKYIIYFSGQKDSIEYHLYIDESDVPIKTIKGSGGYLSKTELEGISVGQHVLYVSAVDKEGTEQSIGSATFNKVQNEGTFTEVPQVYIYTDKEITKEYHESKDVTVTIADKDGGTQKDIIDSSSNIKIRGNSTASADKKPWNIKFDSKTDVLGMGKGKKWCLLANAYDKSLMRNKMVYEFGKKMGMPYTSDSRYVDVYLNGKYNGNYLLTVPVEVKKERINIKAYDSESNDILLEVGTRYESDVNHFKTGYYGMTFDVNDPEKDGDLDNELVLAKINRVNTFLTEFEKALAKVKYEKVKPYIDVQSFVDMYVVNEYFKNADFSFSSTRFYIKDNVLYAGPLWDFDLSCGNVNPKQYTGYYTDGIGHEGLYGTNMLWFKKLMQIPEFQEAVKKRFESLQYSIQNLYKEDSQESLSINMFLYEYGNSIERDSRPIADLGAGWKLSGGGGYVGISYTTTAKWTQWEQPIDFLRDWLKKRNEWMCAEWGIDIEEAYAHSNPDNQELNGQDETTSSAEDESQTISKSTEETAIAGDESINPYIKQV